MKENKFAVEQLRRANSRILLRLARDRGEVSRIELAKATGLSHTTVSAITEDLTRSGLMRERRVGESSGGRKPIMYELDPAGRYVVSGSMGMRGSSFALAGLDGGIAARVDRSGVPVGSSAAAAAMTEAIGSLLQSSGVERAKILGFSLCVPGLIDDRTQTVLLSSPLSLRDFSVREALAPFGPSEVRVYKDADARLLAERRFGAGRGLRNIAYLWIDKGVGMSYMHEGSLMILPKGGFELGHCTIDFRGEECKCGSTGCLGTQISEAPALARYAALLGDRGLAASRGIDYSGLIGLAGTGDACALRAIEREIEILGVVAANIVNLFNPELLIVGGPLADGPDSMKDAFRGVVARRVLEPFRGTSSMVFSSLPEEDSLAAMALVAFDSLLFDPVGA